MSKFILTLIGLCLWLAAFSQKEISNGTADSLSTDEQTIELALSYTQKAIELETNGQIGAAESYLDKAIKIYHEHDEFDHVELGLVYMLKASTITYQYKEYHRAVELIEEAIRIYEKNYGKNHNELAKPYYELGRSYNLLDQLEIGIPYLKKSLEISIKHNDFTQTFRAYFYLGESLFKAGKVKEAKTSFLKGQSMVNQRFGTDHVGNAYFSTGLAFCAMAEGRMSDTERHFFEAERLYILNYGNIHPKLAFLYSMIGDYFNQTGQLQEALYYYKATVQTNKQALDSGEYKVADHGMNISVREKQADLLISLFTSNQDSTLLQRVDDLYYQNISSLKLLIGRTNPGNDLSELSNQYRSTYDRLIDFTLLKYERIINERLKEKLFIMSEDARSVLQALRTNELALAQQSSSEILKTALADKINYTRGVLQREDLEDETATAYSQTLIELNAEREGLIQQQKEGNEPNSWIATTSIDSVQKHLAADQKILEFQKLKDGYLAFVIGKSSYEMVRLKVDESELKSHLSKFQNALEKDIPENFGIASYQLYNQLIAPLSDHVQNSRLIIIPDDLLWNVKFDLLISEAPRRGFGFKDFQYLIKSHPITLAYAAKLAFNSSQNQDTENSLLAFSYDSKTTEVPKLSAMRNVALSNLPGTALEVAKIDKMIETDAFFGNQASEENFKNHAPQYQILHLAMHAMVDSTNYEDVWLRFMTDTTGNDDGKLEIYELQKLRLQADLVVLSACNSGQGRLYRGEGIMGLGSAFLFAGAKSVLLSKWEVSDAVSPEIMEYFYSNIKQGLPKDKALQQAKLSFLQNANNLSENPLYWGSFYIVGDPTALKLQQSLPSVFHWQFLIIGLTLIAVIFIRINK